MEKDREYIIKTLVNGLSRLEYRMSVLEPSQVPELIVVQVDMIPQVLLSMEMKKMRFWRSKKLARLPNLRSLLPSQNQI